jgi:hypothetical protein
MKVKMLTIAAGPDPSQYHDAGTVVDLPRAKAKELIESGQAVAVDEKAEAQDEDEDVAEPRTPNEEQAGEFGRRAVTPETTSAKHAHAEEAVKVDDKHKPKH